MESISPKIITASAERKAVSINLRAVEIRNPRSLTRFFQKTVEDQKAKAARIA
jgi:hypothetical protein